MSHEGKAPAAVRETIPELSQAEFDRLMQHWPMVMRKATDQWAKQFAFSIWKQSGRKGWRPTLKQRQVMRAMVRELFTSGVLGDEDEIHLIEE